MHTKVSITDAEHIAKKLPPPKLRRRTCKLIFSQRVRNHGNNTSNGNSVLTIGRWSTRESNCPATGDAAEATRVGADRRPGRLNRQSKSVPIAGSTRHFRRESTADMPPTSTRKGDCRRRWTRRLAQPSTGGRQRHLHDRTSLTVRRSASRRTSTAEE